jgi:hypothetical protein
MNNKEFNHAMGLEKALRRKAAYLLDAAVLLDAAKEGRSSMAVRFRSEADAATTLADTLKAAIDQQVWLGKA